jgi:hypothetical protein
MTSVTSMTDRSDLFIIEVRRPGFMLKRVIFLVAISVSVTVPALAQSVGTIEVGAHFSSLRLSGVDETDTGVGGRATWNITDAAAIEGTVDIFPTGDGVVERGGRKVVGLVGAKIGWRTSRLGLFGKARTGFARVSEGRQAGVCIQIFPQPSSCYAPQTRLAFDLGGVFEIYPSNRSSLRLDVGDLLTRLSQQSHRFARRGDYAHDVLVTAGFAWRF